jgi:hypothetical protein
MQPFPHFHWIALDGKRPNIPENFIRDEFKITTSTTGLAATEDVKMQVEGSAPQQNSGLSDKRTAKVIPPVIHNISKELQIFLENFEQRFRKEIKVSRLSTSGLFSITKELAISNDYVLNYLGLNVIQNAPSVVELLPYMMEFLMNNLVSTLYLILRQISKIRKTQRYIY